MNVFTRRPTLLNATHRAFPLSNTQRYDAYDEESDELGADKVDFENDEAEIGYDADQELQYRRAELDHRLKNTFESIFAKYERDFDGIGDEIDLRTGEVVVDNGHLLEMMNEKDAGIERRRWDGEEESDEEEEAEDYPEDQDSADAQEILDSADEDEGHNNGYVDEQVIGSDPDHASVIEYEEEPVDDEVEVSTETSMDDDDLILRGFAQASRFARTSPMLQSTAYQHQAHSKGLATQDDFQSAHRDILEQFGPELGPQIVEYITQQDQAAKDSHIEPAWRAPELPKFTKPQPTVNRMTSRAPLPGRARSPEESASIWAAPSIRRSRATHSSRRILPSLPAYMSQHTSQSARPGEPRRIRNNFTEAEDEAMLQYITKAQQQGQQLSSSLLWKGLAAQVCGHLQESPLFILIVR